MTAEELMEDRAAHTDEHAQLWKPVQINPVPLLASLRQAVLTINPKRCPKWRFRLATNVVFQLQARPERGALFAGIVLQGDGITREHFTKKGARHGRGFLSVSFAVGELMRSPLWLLQMRSTPAHSKDFPAAQALKDRVIAAMTSLDRLTEAMMFQPACVICGKRLTDPVSMARWIGPECSHNHTLDVGLFKLS